jgi:hypothetical protein
MPVLRLQDTSFWIIDSINQAIIYKINLPALHGVNAGRWCFL